MFVCIKAYYMTVLFQTFIFSKKVKRNTLKCSLFIHYEYERYLLQLKAMV